MRSMSRKGRSPDNSACEGFFGCLTNEFFCNRDWESIAIEKFTEELDEYMRYCRGDYVKESLGWMSPMRYRKSLGLTAWLLQCFGRSSHFGWKTTWFWEYLGCSFTMAAVVFD